MIIKIMDFTIIVQMYIFIVITGCTGAKKKMKLHLLYENQSSFDFY